MSSFAGWLALGEASDRPPASQLDSIFSQSLDGPGLDAARSWRGSGILLTHRRHVTAPEDVADRQPRRGDESPFVLVFDGYLINREDLAEALGWPAETQRRPDSAFALAAFERWGDEAPSRLLGDFALALWNERDRTLLLARDGIGQRPLYYHHGGDVFAFATTPRALLALPGVPRELHEGSFARFLLDLAIDPGDTLHAGLKRLPPGHQAVVADGRIWVRRYWEPDYERRVTFKRDDDYVEAARELLDRAVRACLRIEGTPVSAITGGLDSSGVAATALRHLPGGRLSTVTAVHSAPTMALIDTYADERPFVEAVARMHPGLEPAFLAGSDLHRWDERWSEMFLRTGLPWRNIMNIAWLGPSRDHARALGARVLLSGQLGNFTLSWGGLEGLPGAFRRGEWRYVAGEVRALAAGNGHSLLREFWRAVLAPQLPTHARQGLDRIRGKRDSDHWLRFSAIRPDLAYDLRLDAESARQWQMPVVSPTTIRRPFFAMLQGTMDMAGLSRALDGLETRSPLADRRLLEFCLAVPDRQYLRGGITRWLARRTLADRLPSEVIGNRQRGWQSGDFFHRMTLQKGAIAQGVAQLEGSALAGRLLDLPRMKRMMEDWPENETKAGPAYMTVLHRGLHCGQFLRWLEGDNG